MVLDVTKLALCVITRECSSWVECSGCRWQEKLYYSAESGKVTHLLFFFWPIFLFVTKRCKARRWISDMTGEIFTEPHRVRQRSAFPRFLLFTQQSHSLTEIFAFHFQCIFNILCCTVKASWCCSGDSCIDGLQQNKLILYATNTIYMSRRIRLACWDVKQSHSLTGVTQAKLNT